MRRKEDGPLEHDAEFETVDTSVIFGAQANIQQSWRKVVEVYFPMVYSRCRSVGLNQHDANDVCQNVFKNLATSIGRFSRDVSTGSLGAWIHTITRRKLADHFERLPPTVNDAEDILNSLEAEREPTTNVRSFEFSVSALKAINFVKVEFSETSWLAFWKVTVEGMAPGDVAKELNISRNAVYLARSRIMSRLREELQLPDSESKS